MGGSQGEVPVRTFALGVVASITLCTNASAAALQRTFAELVGNSQRPYVVAAFYRSEERLELVREGDVVKAESDPQSAALALYYQNQMLGRPQLAANSWYVQDGSKQRFLAGLQAIPNRYEGYRTLSGVVVSEHVGWGPFVVEIVTLSGNDGREQPWREALVCGRGCFISNAIDKPDASFELLDAARTALTTTTRSQGELQRFFDAATRAQRLPALDTRPYGRLPQRPLEIAAQFDRPEQPIDVALPHSGAGLGAIGGVELTRLVEWLSALKRIEVDATETRPLTSAAIERELNASLENRVDAATADDLFYFASAYKTGPRAAVRVANEWYHPIAAVQRVHRWARLSIVGSIVAGDDAAVFYQPTQETQANTTLREPVQVALLHRHAAGDWRVASRVRNALVVVRSDTVLEIAGKALGNEVTFVYEETP